MTETVKMPKLTGKQQKFVDILLSEPEVDNKNAAIRAGYSEKTAAEMAHENLKKPHIQKYIELARKKVEKEITITAADLVDDLIKIKNMCLGGETLDFRGATQAIKTIADIIGANNHEQKINSKVNFNLIHPDEKGLVS